MELVLGKKFKLEVWEVIVQKMAINEVAKFTVDKSVSLYYNYITLSVNNYSFYLVSSTIPICIKST